MAGPKSSYFSASYLIFTVALIAEGHCLLDSRFVLLMSGMSFRSALTFVRGSGSDGPTFQRTSHIRTEHYSETTVMACADCSRSMPFPSLNTCFMHALTTSGHILPEGNLYCQLHHHSTMVRVCSCIQSAISHHPQRFYLLFR